MLFFKVYLKFTTCFLFVVHGNQENFEINIQENYGSISLKHKLIENNEIVYTYITYQKQGKNNIYWMITTDEFYNNILSIKKIENPSTQVTYSPKVQYSKAITSLDIEDLRKKFVTSIHLLLDEFAEFFMDPETKKIFYYITENKYIDDVIGE